MSPRVLVVWCVACLLWSGTFLFIRLGVSHVPPLTFAWLRLLIAGAVLAAITVARGGFAGVRGRDVMHIMGAGVLLLGVNYGLTYWGARLIPSGLVAILQSSTPVLAMAIGWAIGAEAVTLRKCAALAAGVAGVLLTFREEAPASAAGGLAGLLAVAGGSICVAVAYVWLKRKARRVPPLTVTTLQCFAGLIPLMTVGLVAEGNPFNAGWTLPAIGALLYLSIGASVVAFGLNYWLLQRMDTSAMLMMGVAEVPIAVSVGAFFFDERLPPGMLAGGACVLAGVMLTFFGKGSSGRGQTPGFDPGV
jgi:drug/metabolite transporter (DMT)-like permease